MTEIQLKIEAIEKRIGKMKTNMNLHRIEEGVGNYRHEAEYFTMEARIEQAYDEIDELCSQDEKGMEK